MLVPCLFPMLQRRNSLWYAFSRWSMGTRILGLLKRKVTPQSRNKEQDNMSQNSLLLKNTPVSKPMPAIDQPLQDNLIRLTFYTVFFLIFCFSGLLSMITSHSYRMGLVSSLVIPLVVLYGFKLDRVFFAYIILTFFVVLSALYNKSSVFDFVIFMRILGFSYLIYYLVAKFINSDNIIKIIRICVIISVIQLPVILLQLFMYDKLPFSWTINIVPVDFDFGTFNYKGDSTMSFFLTSLIIFLLFDHKRNYFIKRRMLLAIYLTITIMIANAQVVKVIILLVWSAYMIRNLRPSTVFLIVFLVVGVSQTATTLYNRGIINENPLRFIFKVQNVMRAQNYANDARYFSGGYGRSAALYYYATNDILWFGDGPSRYSDVFTKTFVRGNTGHIYTFYSEVGLFGWIASMIVLFLIAFKWKEWRFRDRWVPWLMFISISILSFTNQVMNDVAVVLIYCIMAKSCMIPVMKTEGN